MDDNKKSASKSASMVDIETSFSIVAYLFGAFSGKQSWCHVLSKLQSSHASSGELVLNKEHVKTCEGWLHKVYSGEALICADWKSPQNAIANSILNLLEKLKFELIDLSEKIDSVLAAGDYSSSKDRVSLLVSAFARFAASRYTYLELYTHFAKHLERPKLQQQYETLLAQAGNDVRLAHLFLSVVTAQSKPQETFFKDMRDECILLAGIFRSNVHDINQLLHFFNKPFTFDQAEIYSKEAQAWKEVKLTPATAGYWKAYGFTPQETVKWQKVGFVDPSIASGFNLFGFQATEAASWIGQGIPPVTAKRWRAAGHDLKSAMDMFKQGILEPTTLEATQETSL